MTRGDAVDAVVVGAGPNGLVAANLLADRGWRVVVLEGAPVPGGAVRTAEVTAPGFRSDLFSAFYPLGAASPVLRSLDLERWGLRWARSHWSVAHPLPDGRLAAIGPTPTETAALLAEECPADHAAWLELAGRWSRVGPSLVRALLSPFPPVRGGAEVAWAARRDVPWLARLALLPVRTLGEETFDGEGGRLLLAGNALHADLTPESAGSGLFGMILCGLAQDVGFPAPVGGAGALTDALLRRLDAAGGEVRCDQPVTGIEVEAGRAVGVTTPDGFVPARRAVLASVSAPALYQRLLAPDHVPARVLEGMARWQPGTATVKVDWALDAPIPWSDPRLGAAGTVHLADSVDALSRTASDMATGAVPEDPFVLLGQMTAVDPTRSPEGTESAWAYTHGPQELAEGTWDDATVASLVARMEAVVERWAPGFGRTIRARHVQGPRELEAANPNLVGGAINNGTAQLHQQLVFRPVPGLARAETPVDGLYLASAAAHPGGGVHGACGANAARAALFHDRLRRAGDSLRGAAGALAGRAGRSGRPAG